MIKKRMMKAALCVITMLLCVTGGFFIGKHVEDISFQREQMLDVLLHRSNFEGLGEIDGTIYVTGHKNPDTDSVGSAVAYADLLKKLGYDAIPVIPGDINYETEYVLKTAGVKKPEILENASGLNMILVDHSDYDQSVDGLGDANVIEIIDHHGDGDVMTDKQLIYDSKPFGANATIIWMQYRNYGIVPDKQDAILMLGSILSDTNNLYNEATTYADKKAVAVLRDIAEINDTDEFYTKMYKEYISYRGMSDEEIFFSDYKVYESHGIKYSIGCISVYDEDEAKSMSERIKNIVASIPPSTEMDMSYAQINIFHDDVSVSYIVPSDDAAGEAIEKAFSKSAKFDGTSYKLKPGLSRKKDFVPAIAEVLKNNR